VSRSTRAGTAAERAVVTYLQANGFPHAERALNLAAALAEAQVEAANAGVRRYLAVLKRRRRRPVGGWYALMPLWLAVELLGEDGR
jgi:hypothetical protein